MIAYGSRRSMHKGKITMLGRIMAGSHAVIAHNAAGQALFVAYYPPDIHLSGRVPLACGSFGNLTNQVKSPHFSTCMRGLCHGLPSLFLPVGVDRAGMAVRHAPVGVAQRPRCCGPDDTGAHTPTAQALPYAHTLCRPHH